MVIWMKICIASEGSGGLKDTVSAQFGRCPTFTVVDIDKEIKNVYVIPNPGASAASGAGIQAGQAVVNEGCKAAIAGAIGPNSAQVLAMAGVDMRIASHLPVKEVVFQYMENKLPPARAGSGTGRGRGMGQGMGRGRGMRRF